LLDAVVVPHFLAEPQFQRLLNCVQRITARERVHIPRHKRGATIAYETLRQIAPEVVTFYWSPEVLEVVSSLAKETVAPTPIHDQSSCSILIYDQPGDRIGWHYDWNFYNGRHFTALLALINRNASGTGPSSAQLLVRSPGGERVVPTPPNTFVLFEGAFVRHCVRPLGSGEMRVMLSMTFCTNPNASALKHTLRRFKDIAYFGPRALWT
jgi:hypothetical protein